ncbi:MAG: YbaN family protein [Bacteroidales bacterium]
MKKILYIIGGCLAVTLGIIGIFVPGLPTTPFLLLASWLFYHSSERLHRKLNASWLGKYIRRYNNKEGVSLTTKLTSIACMTTMISISIIFFLNDTKTRLLVAGLGVIGICSILFAVPNQKKKEKFEVLRTKEIEEQNI